MELVNDFAIAKNFLKTYKNTDKHTLKKNKRILESNIKRKQHRNTIHNRTRFCDKNLFLIPFEYLTQSPSILFGKLSRFKFTRQSSSCIINYMFNNFINSLSRLNSDDIIVSIILEDNVAPAYDYDYDYDHTNYTLYKLYHVDLSSLYEINLKLVRMLCYYLPFIITDHDNDDDMIEFNEDIGKYINTLLYNQENSNEIAINNLNNFMDSLNYCVKVPKPIGRIKNILSAIKSALLANQFLMNYKISFVDKNNEIKTYVSDNTKFDNEYSKYNSYQSQEIPDCDNVLQFINFVLNNDAETIEMETNEYTKNDKNIL